MLQSVYKTQLEVDSISMQFAITVQSKKKEDNDQDGHYQ